MTYALQNPEHLGRTRGKGLVPWKYGFREYIDSYRSRNRRRNDVRLGVARLLTGVEYTRVRDIAWDVPYPSCNYPIRHRTS